MHVHNRTFYPYKKVCAVTVKEKLLFANSKHSIKLVKCNLNSPKKISN